MGAAACSPCCSDKISENNQVLLDTLVTPRKYMQSTSYVPSNNVKEGESLSSAEASTMVPDHGSLASVDEDETMMHCPPPISARSNRSGTTPRGLPPGFAPPPHETGTTTPRGAPPQSVTQQGQGTPSREGTGGGMTSAHGADGEGARPANYFDGDAEEFKKMKPARSEKQEQRQPYSFASGAVYSGQWRGNARHGLGVQRWPDGATYAGEWRTNMAEGQGCFTHSDGDTYTGEWKGNVAHGKGIYRMTDVSVYEGEWVSDLQEGFGVESWGNEGTAYAGYFHNGEKEGHGMYYWADGSEYCGEWAENVMKGVGAYVGCDGRSFKGTWHESLMHGIGIYEWPDGQRYCGEYTDDQKDGFGIFVFPDGRRYEGFWRDGQPAEDDGAEMIG